MTLTNVGLLLTVAISYALGSCNVRNDSGLLSSVSWEYTPTYIDSLAERHCKCANAATAQVGLRISHANRLDLSGLEFVVSMDGVVYAGSIDENSPLAIDVCHCGERDFFSFIIYGIDKKHNRVYMWTDKEVHKLGAVTSFDLSLLSDVVDGNSLKVTSTD